MSIDGTPKELANFILCLLKSETGIMVSDLPPAVRESIKGYFDREVESG